MTKPPKKKQPPEATPPSEGLLHHRRLEAFTEQIQLAKKNSGIDFSALNESQIKVVIETLLEGTLRCHSIEEHRQAMGLLVGGTERKVQHNLTPFETDSKKRIYLWSTVPYKAS